MNALERFSLELSAVCSADDREEWLRHRMDGVGGSDIAAVLGEHPYATREQLRMEKSGLADGFAGNEATEIGSAMEPTIAQIAEQRWGWQLTRCALLLRDGHCPRLQVTPDYLLESPFGLAAVQIKLTSCAAQEDCKPRRDGSPSTAAFANGPPIYHQLQLQAEMAVLGANQGVLLCLHLQPMKLRAYYVPRHDLVIARIRREVPVFWAEVEALRDGRISV